MTLTQYRRSMSEVEMQQTIKDAVERLDGRAWHIRDSRGFDVRDMPDLVIAIPASGNRPGVVGLIEVKSQNRPITDGQRDVLDILATCTRVVSGVVRPEPRVGEMSLDDVLAVLKGEVYVQ